MTILDAEIAQVNLGETISTKGLMDGDGNYYVGIPQLSDINLVPPGRSLKQLKSLLGNSFPSHQIVKLKTPLNSKPINAVPLEIFERLIVEMSFNGNEAAQSLVRVLVGQSLYQLFCDAFKVKHDAEDRQRWLTSRFNTKHDFRPLTDQLQKHGFRQPNEYAKFIHLMQSRVGVESGGRDLASYELLNKLERAQTRLTAYMECGIKPYDALNKI